MWQIELVVPIFHLSVVAHAYVQPDTCYGLLVDRVYFPKPCVHWPEA